MYAVYGKPATPTRHLGCVVSPPIMITECTHGEHGKYDLTIIILWNDHYDFNFNVGMNDVTARNENEKHDYQFYHA